MGFVAERCPACDTVRSFRIVRLGQTSHIFWLPLGKGRLIGYYGVCQQCAGEIDIEPTDYASICKRQPESLAELQTVTNPRLDPNNRDAVSSHERFRRVRDPLLRFNTSLLQRYAGGTRFDKTSGLAFFATLAIPFTIFAVDLTFLSQEIQDALGQVAISGFVLGLVASFVVLAREPRRFFRRQIEPQIARELSQVNPRPDELDDCLAKLKKYEYKIRDYVSTTRLMELMQTTDCSAIETMVTGLRFCSRQQH